MRRLKIAAERETDDYQASRHDFRMWAAPKVTPTKTYEMSLFGKIKDLGVSSLNLFSYQGTTNPDDVLPVLSQLVRKLEGLCEFTRNKKLNKEINKIQENGKFDLLFAYPVMNPQVSNSAKLVHARAALIRVMKKFDLIKSGQVSLKVARENMRLIEKFTNEKNALGREISNREQMEHILQQLTMPNSFKRFLEEADKLSSEDKDSLIRLTTEKERLSLNKESVKAPYELMFAYDLARDDFTVGIRSLYEHSHPHPTLLGGLDPEVRVAGTIDLVLAEDGLKIAKIRIDSGHFQPDAESLEIIMRYIRQEMNPNYYDQLVLHTMEGDSSVPEIVVSRQNLRM